MSLEVNVCGLKLKNPLILASGVLGISTAMFKRLSRVFGALTTKSIGLKPRKGHRTPVVVPLEYGVLNSMGLPNPGVEEFSRVIREAKSKVNVPIIASVYGFTIREYVKTAFKLEEAGADAIELNLSCPHVGEIRAASQNPELAGKIVSEVKPSLKVPLLVKLSAETCIVDVARECEKSGADAIVAINTLKAVCIDIWSCKPVFKSIYCGLSGPAIKPVAIRCVYDLYEKVSIPIIGVGGITSWEDIIEFMLAGASAVEIGTAIALKGIESFKEEIRHLSKYLVKKGFKSISDIIGLAHKK